MKWVVLSDLHMKFNNFDSSQARKKLIEELEKKKGSISFVLITGDCFLKNDGNTWVSCTTGKCLWHRKR